MDRTNRLYRAMFRWHEIGESSKDLPFPALGGFAIFLLFTAMDGLPDKSGRVLAALCTMAAILALCKIGSWLSERMVERTIWRLNHEMFGKADEKQ